MNSDLFCRRRVHSLDSNLFKTAVFDQLKSRQQQPKANKSFPHSSALTLPSLHFPRPNSLGSWSLLSPAHTGLKTTRKFTSSRTRDEACAVVEYTNYLKLVYSRSSVNEKFLSNHSGTIICLPLFELKLAKSRSYKS